ncbi:hypothetical protein E3N88_45222 [Mikania micrantha]|uniref:Uncharacterized protein n=1 Tax=Mikania micrantha TaxID=192012 RepID=A0A5N6L9S6_9ASTR|nr:hypothetical protein E3N88_45222 [Mikania micrantha]
MAAAAETGQKTFCRRQNLLGQNRTFLVKIRPKSDLFGQNRSFLVKIRSKSDLFGQNRSFLVKSGQNQNFLSTDLVKIGQIWSKSDLSELNQVRRNPNRRLAAARHTCRNPNLG